MPADSEPLAGKSKTPVASEEALPSEEETEEEEETTDSSEPAEKEAEEKAPAPQPPAFKLSTFILVFLFFMGLWMIIDPNARTQVATGLGALLYPAFGFDGHYPLLTMVLVALVQMTISAIAYNYTTNWVESAKVQHHAKAIRPLQMQAMKSGKKQHMEALKPHMSDLNARQSQMMMGQMKGMAVTWFLLIAMYTWVGIFLTMSTTAKTVFMFGVQVDLTQQVAIFPLWFLVFSLYTVPFNLFIRRLLKHQTLTSQLKIEPSAPATAP